MANLSFNSSLSLDLGLSGISYQARESVQESLPELREIAPLEEAARNNLEVLLAKPNLASFITAHLRPDIADSDTLTPVRFNKGLQRACADLAGLRLADGEAAATVQRAQRTLSDETRLRDLVAMYRNALLQG